MSDCYVTATDYAVHWLGRAPSAAPAPDTFTPDRRVATVDRRALVPDRRHGTDHRGRRFRLVDRRRPR